MVGPISRDERSSLVRRLKAGFVVLVGGSSGLIAVQGGATLVEVALVTLVGLVVGVVLVWLVFPGTGEVENVRRRGR